MASNVVGTVPTTSNYVDLTFDAEPSSSSTTDTSTSEKPAKKQKKSKDVTKQQWDPMKYQMAEKPSSFFMKRLKKDIENIYREPIPFVFVAPDDDDLTQIHAIICGPEGTPYEGGFFYFFIRVTADYPIKPPLVRLMTTGNGIVRFNPNLYANGKVCLSILGTWPGPEWTAAQSISSMLVSIQSLMNDKPLFNEPGITMKSHGDEFEQYNNYIRHEVLRVAALDNVEGFTKLPPSLYAFIKSSFPDYIEHYQKVIGKNKMLDGKTMQHFFRYGDNGKYRYKELESRLNVVKEKYKNRQDLRR